MATETLFGGQVSFNLAMLAKSLVIEVDAKHTYANITGSKPWRLWIEIDGTEYGSGDGSGYGTDCPSARAAVQNVTAGTHGVVVKWWGDPSMKISRANLTIQWSYF